MNKRLAQEAFAIGTLTLSPLLTAAHGLSCFTPNIG